MSADADADRWLAADRDNRWQTARVVDAVHDAADAVILGLELPEPPEAEAGQYYLVRLAIDTAPGAVQQAYSLCSAPDPSSTRIEIAVREVPGGRASPRLVHEVHGGDHLEVRGPFGFLVLDDGDVGPVGLIGAGSGVAPLVSLARGAARRATDTPMTLLCSSRDRSTLLLADALESLDAAHDWFSVTHTFTRSPDDGYAAYHRRIDAAMLAEVFGDDTDRLGPGEFFVAGPGAMVLDVQQALVDLGVPADRIATEDHA